MSSNKSNKSFQLENLPTESAAAVHGYRTYHQLQLWDKNPKNATEWGWKINEEKKLIPVQSEKEMIPEKILKIVSCGCKTKCNSLICSCKKFGILCSELCLNCSDKCSNRKKVTFDDGLEHSDTEFGEDSVLFTSTLPENESNSLETLENTELAEDDEEELEISEYDTFAETSLSGDESDISGYEPSIKKSKIQ